MCSCSTSAQAADEHWRSRARESTPSPAQILLGPRPACCYGAPVQRLKVPRSNALLTAQKIRHRRRYSTLALLPSRCTTSSEAMAAPAAGGSGGGIGVAGSPLVGGGALTPVGPSNKPTLLPAAQQLNALRAASTTAGRSRAFAPAPIVSSDSGARSGGDMHAIAGASLFSGVAASIQSRDDASEAAVRHGQASAWANSGNAPADASRPSVAPARVQPKRRLHRRLLVREIARRHAARLHEQQLLALEEDGGASAWWDPEGAAPLDAGPRAATAPRIHDDKRGAEAKLRTALAEQVSTSARAREFLRDYWLLANVLYIVGQAGYVACNYSRAYLVFHPDAFGAAYNLLAWAFILDSIWYWLSWAGADPAPDAVTIWAEYLNIFASVLYAITAACYIPSENDLHISNAVYTLEAIATFVFGIDAVFYLYAWYSTVPPGKVRASSQCSLRGPPV